MGTKILTENQAAFLERLRDSPFLKENFYLTGGTALAAFYLEHRYSEDLDFFSESEFDLLDINVFLDGLKQSLPIAKIDFQQSFNRNLFFLHFDSQILKVEFIFFPFPRLEKSEEKEGILIDSLLDIAVNKLFTIYQRTNARDYIDLYFICQEKNFSIADLVQKARVKFDWHIDPLQLGAQFVKALEVKDYPRMIREVPTEKWQGFFIEEAKKLKDDIVME